MLLCMLVSLLYAILGGSSDIPTSKGPPLRNPSRTQTPTITLTEVVRIHATYHQSLTWTIIGGTGTEHATLKVDWGADNRKLRSRDDHNHKHGLVPLLWRRRSDIRRWWADDLPHGTDACIGTP
ncbi:hypothetical protein BJY04DRAFT_222639 [Aspergillus karnatakaensis]|uniref:uncharacterized protein n=1 Tax=Aspergillus karnatakaensis TaxID=1810916 RepID=UPI003CCE4CA7